MHTSEIKRRNLLSQPEAPKSQLIGGMVTWGIVQPGLEMNTNPCFCALDFTFFNKSIINQTDM